jgi:hypothetical protein
MEMACFLGGSVCSRSLFCVAIAMFKGDTDKKNLKHVEEEGFFSGCWRTMLCIWTFVHLYHRGTKRILFYEAVHHTKHQFQMVRTCGLRDLYCINCNTSLYYCSDVVSLFELTDNPARAESTFRILLESEDLFDLSSAVLQYYCERADGCGPGDMVQTRSGFRCIWSHSG